jgi:hypothetical protein
VPAPFVARIQTAALERIATNYLAANSTKAQHFVEIFPTDASNKKAGAVLLLR